MSLVRLVATLVLCGVLSASRPASAADGSSPHEGLFRDLSAETAAVRDVARVRLEKAADLSADEVRAALATADHRAKPLLLRVAAARGMKTLVPDAAAALASDDPLVSDAAARALVSLGDDAVAAGLASLSRATGVDAEGLRVHVQALASQRAIEKEIFGRWRRKGGSYEGRYADLAKFGWPVQPLLLAMLLDVPLCDRDIVLPPSKGPADEYVTKATTLEALARSNRRGYRTFEPLPVGIEADEMFDLSVQALKDVADLDLMGEILENVSATLQMFDERHRQRLRRPEEYFSREIDVALAARGRPARLEALAARIRTELSFARTIARRFDGDPAAEQEALARLSNQLEKYGAALHQLRKYDRAADCFRESLDIDKKLGGKLSAISAYNCACALACGRRIDEAFEKLDAALDREQSTGGEDLTREWVTEDGDLRNLRDDPRWPALIKRRFDQ